MANLGNSAVQVIRFLKNGAKDKKLSCRGSVFFFQGKKMSRGSKRQTVVAIVITTAALAGIRAAIAQKAPPPQPLLAEQAFKNVQVMKGIPVDDFMQTMGLMT